MAKTNEESGAQTGGEGVISIIGPGMRVIGDCRSEGTLRIEGTVEGTVRAAKAVVVGKDGVVDGDIATQDAVVGGRVTGSIVADSRLELQASCVVEGEIRARRIKLEEGGTVNGMVHIGETSRSSSSGATVQGSGAGGSHRPAGGPRKPAESGSSEGEEEGKSGGPEQQQGGS